MPMPPRRPAYQMVEWCERVQPTSSSSAPFQRPPNEVSSYAIEQGRTPGGQAQPGARRDDEQNDSSEEGDATSGKTHGPLPSPPLYVEGNTGHTPTKSGIELGTNRVIRGAYVAFRSLPHYRLAMFRPPVQELICRGIPRDRWNRSSTDIGTEVCPLAASSYKYERRGRPSVTRRPERRSSPTSEGQSRHDECPATQRRQAREYIVRSILWLLAS